jgi:hypothetical protein
MKIIKFFDKLEDRVRGWFSHRPLRYGLVGGVGIVLFWRGMWHTADYLSILVSKSQFGESSIDLSAAGPWWDGPLSLFLGGILLLITGLFTSNFIGNEIIISGLRGEKKLTEKTEAEVRTETGAIGEIKEEIKKISKRLDEIEKKL